MSKECGSCPIQEAVKLVVIAGEEARWQIAKNLWEFQENFENLYPWSHNYKSVSCKRDSTKSTMRSYADDPKRWDKC